MPKPLHHKSWRQDLFWLILIFACYFLLFLGTRPLNIPDEGRYPSIGWDMLAHHNWITPKLDGVPFLDKPILYYWLEAISMHIFGVNNWAIRFPQGLFGIIGCLLVYMTGIKCFNRSVAIKASFLMATTPLYFVAANYSNMDLEVAIWLCAAFCCFLFSRQYDDQPWRQRLWMWAAFICASGAFLTKGMIGIALPMLVIGIWIILCHRWRVLKKMALISGIILFVALTLPWFIAAQKQNPHFLYYFFYYQQVDRFLSESHFNNAMPFWFYPPIILAGCLPWSLIALPGIARLKALWRNRQQHDIMFLCALWVIIITLFFSIPRSKIVGYILPIVPILALLIARYIDEQQQNPSKAFHWSSKIMSILGIVVGIGLFIAPHVAPNLAAATFTFSLCGLAFLLGGIITLHVKPKQQFWVWVIAMACINMTALFAIPQVDHKTSLPLIQQVRPYIKPNTEFVSYYSYYQDIPIYLQKRVKVVNDWDQMNVAHSDNWTRDFHYGLTNDPNSRKILIDTKTFKTLWKHKPLIVFSGIGDYHLLAKTLQPKAIFIGQYRGLAAFRN